MKTVEQILSGIRPEADYAASEDFFEDALLDSIDIIRLVSELESNFSISIDPADIVPEHFINTEAVSALVETCLNK